MMTLQSIARAAPEQAPGSQPSLIEFKHINHAFGDRPILKDVNLTVHKSEFVCLIGPSGCGKTTLLRMIGGLLTPQSGDVTYAGHRVTEPESDVAFMFQDYSKALLPWRTATGNVSLALEAGRMPKAQRPARIQELLLKVGLGRHADHYPRNSPAACSSGYRSRAVSPRTPLCC